MTIWDIIKKGAGWIANNPELVLGAISAYQNAQDSAQAEAWQKEALALAREQYNDRGPLRAMGMATALGSPYDYKNAAGETTTYQPYKAPGLASLGSTSANTPALGPMIADPRNPYSRLNRLPAIARSPVAGPPVATTPLPPRPPIPTVPSGGPSGVGGPGTTTGGPQDPFAPPDPNNPRETDPFLPPYVGAMRRY